MQKFVKNMEKRFGRYAIPDLINYFIVCYVASTIISLFMPGLYYGFLALDFEKIMHGQVWRLFTFILAPETLSSGFFGTGINIFFFVIKIHIYYLFGHSLENMWGAFRFNLYFIGGIILTILAELILFVTTGQSAYYGGMNYLYHVFCLLCAVPGRAVFDLFCVPDQGEGACRAGRHPAGGGSDSVSGSRDVLLLSGNRCGDAEFPDFLLCL